MRFMFVGDPAAVDQRSEPASVTMYGLEFPLRVAVDCSGLTEAQVAKLAWNSHFELVSDGPASAGDDDRGPGVDYGGRIERPEDAGGPRRRARPSAAEPKPKRARTQAQVASDARLAERARLKREAKASGDGPDQG